jgi:hypothetical protein
LTQTRDETSAAYERPKTLIGDELASLRESCGIYSNA